MLTPYMLTITGPYGVGKVEIKARKDDNSYTLNKRAYRKIYEFQKGYRKHVKIELFQDNILIDTFFGLL